MWTDTHCHLNMLETSIDEALQLAGTNQVTKFFNIGTCPDDLDIVYETAKKYYPKVFCTQGIHPHDAKLYDLATEQKILSRMPEKEVIAVGEIGLDYYYNNSPKEVQKSVFNRQLEIAFEHKMPIQIHTRDAEEDTIEILKKFGGKISGILHCFTGTKWLADEGMKLGLNISISGVVTFKKAIDLQNIIKTVPLNRIHVETDAPFLAPVPKRGQKNTPAYLVHTAEYVANLKNISLLELAKICEENTLQTFPRFC